MRRTAAPALWRQTGDLERLLDPTRALALFRDAGLEIDAADVFYLRVKPGESAMVGFLFSREEEARGTTVLPAYVRTFPDARSTALAAKWARKKTRATAFGDGVRVLPGGQSVLCLFPHDARLRALPTVSNLAKLKRLLVDLPAFSGRRIRGRVSRLFPVRYKPERRWIARAELRLRDAHGRRQKEACFLRLFPDARGERIARIVRALREGGLRDHVPRAIGSCAQGCLYVEEEVRGEELPISVCSGQAPAEEVAAALSKLHCSTVAQSLPERAVHVPAKAREIAKGLSSAAPLLEEPAARLMALLEERTPDRFPVATIHGDFHPHQVLVGSRGPILVDFERAALGDPLTDVGNFVARVLVRVQREPSASEVWRAFLDRFLEAYRKRAPLRPAGDLEFFVLHGLLEASLLPLRRFAPDWREQAESVLRLAESVVGSGAKTRILVPVERQPEYEVLYPRREGAWAGYAMRPDGSRAFGLYWPDTRIFRGVEPDVDPKLPHLGEWARQGELVSYRVGRRATVRLRREGKVLYAKVMARKKAQRLAERHARLAALLAAAGGGGPGLPTLAEHTKGVLFYEAIGARALHDDLTRGCGAESLAGLGRALARWHGLSPEGLGLSPPSDRPEEWLAVLARADPLRARRYAAHALRLAARPPPDDGEERLLHGDLHDRNILVDGENLWLLDLDLARAGAPAADMGNLAAHLVLRALQRGEPAHTANPGIALLLDAYGQAGEGIAPPALAAWTARALFRLACLYSFRRRWLHLPDVLLSESVRWGDSGADLRTTTPA